jgi:hypothetical protein
MIKNGNEYYCDCCGELIAICDTDINYEGVDLLCDRCSRTIERIYSGGKKDTSEYCDNLRDKDNPRYPQGCKLGNTTSPLWCEKKERCYDFKAQESVK